MPNLSIYDSLPSGRRALVGLLTTHANWFDSYGLAQKSWPMHSTDMLTEEQFQENVIDKIGAYFANEGLCIHKQPIAANGLFQTHIIVRNDTPVAFAAIRHPDAETRISALENEPTQILKLIQNCQHVDRKYPTVVQAKLFSELRAVCNMGKLYKSLSLLAAKAGEDDNFLDISIENRFIEDNILIIEIVSDGSLKDENISIAVGPFDSVDESSISNSKQIYNQPEPQRVARGILETTLRLIFRHNLAPTGGLFPIIAFGPRGSCIPIGPVLCGPIDKSTTKNLFRCVLNAYSDEVENLVLSLSGSLSSGANSDRELFRSVAASKARTAAGFSPPLTVLEDGEISFYTSGAALLVAVLNTAREEDYTITDNAQGVLHAITAADALSVSFYNNIRAEKRWVFERLQVLAFEDAKELLSKGGVSGFSSSILNLLNDLPEQISSIVADLVSNRLTINIVTEESNRERNVWNSRVKLLASAILCSGFSIVSIVSFEGVAFGEWTAFISAVIALLFFATGLIHWRRLQK